MHASINACPVENVTFLHVYWNQFGALTDCLETLSQTEWIASVAAHSENWNDCKFVC